MDYWGPDRGLVCLFSSFTHIILLYGCHQSRSFPFISPYPLHPPLPHQPLPMFTLTTCLTWKLHIQHPLTSMSTILLYKSKPSQPGLSNVVSKLLKLLCLWYTNFYVCPSWWFPMKIMTFLFLLPLWQICAKMLIHCHVTRRPCFMQFNNSTTFRKGFFLALAIIMS